MRISQQEFPDEFEQDFVNESTKGILEEILRRNTWNISEEIHGELPIKTPEGILNRNSWRNLWIEFYEESTEETFESILGRNSWGIPKEFHGEKRTLENIHSEFIRNA